MKRALRRLLAVVAGLVLGWLAAAHWPGSARAVDDPAAHADARAATAPHRAHPAADAAARLLAPHESTTPWLWPVLGGVAGLFILAAGAGAAVRYLGVRDPSIAATEQDQQAGHGGHAGREPPAGDGHGRDPAHGAKH